jgi:hypothetical protein
MSRAGFEPATLCLKGRPGTIRKTREINDFALSPKGSARFPLSLEFDHFRPFSIPNWHHYWHQRYLLRRQHEKEE